ncbi:MAG: type II secretion system major pseudopilin GspG [Candidatus Omnitrophica bacterium]|nr:type II secretion system major pseudopilin GspG [Candidatus Omnitrophota bacterium]
MKRPAPRRVPRGVRRAASKAQGPRRAFTLVELMLVVIIIGVLAAMVVPRLAGRTEQAKTARAKSDLASIGLALDLYELDAGQYPETLEELVSKDPPSHLSDEARAKWNGPYLKKGLPKDPWGRPYEYKSASQHHQDYDLFSLGPDGQPGHDDVTNWE